MAIQAIAAADGPQSAQGSAHAPSSTCHDMGQGVKRAFEIPIRLARSLAVDGPHRHDGVTVDGDVSK
jgi:hypothetical protein